MYARRAHGFHERFIFGSYRIRTTHSQIKVGGVINGERILTCQPCQPDCRFWNHFIDAQIEISNGVKNVLNSFWGDTAPPLRYEKDVRNLIDSKRGDEDFAVAESSEDSNTVFAILLISQVPVQRQGRIDNPRRHKRRPSSTTS